MGEFVLKMFDQFIGQVKSALPSVVDSTKLVVDTLTPSSIKGFKVYLLKTLLNALHQEREQTKQNGYVDKQKSEVKPVGYRASIPVPKKGINSIGTSTFESRDPVKYITENIPRFLAEYIAKASNNTSLELTLKNIFDTNDWASLDVPNLNDIDTNTVAVSPIIKGDDYILQHYIHANDGVFITPYVKAMAEKLYTRFAHPIHLHYYTESNPQPLKIVNAIVSISYELDSESEAYRNNFINGTALEFSIHKFTTDEVFASIQSGLIANLSYSAIRKKQDTIILILP